MNWSSSDFIVFGFLVGIPSMLYVLVARMTKSGMYRLAMGVAMVSLFLLMWVTLAVGLLADEGNPADLMILGVIAVGIVGAFLGRFTPRGMAFALLAAALTQGLVAVIALSAGIHHSPVSSLAEVVGVNAMFVVLFSSSAALFWHADPKQAQAA